VDVTLVDRQNHHCFQPLLYQVATATLSPADVAWPIRSILSRQRNVRVVMAQATGVDTETRLVRTSGGEFPYDQLVIATGATHAYFGHGEWAQNAPGLKRIEGVEMAGAIADMAREALPPDFRNFDPSSARVILIEAGPRLLAAFPEALSNYALIALERRGVQVSTGEPVTDIGQDYVIVGKRRIPTGSVIWAAGVAASAAADWLGAERDSAGRVQVGPDLSLPGHPEVLVIGDTASVRTGDGTAIPGVAPAAKQMGRYAGNLVAARARREVFIAPFRYRHQGDLATIGRKAAVVRIGGFSMTGFLAWLFWSLAHVYFLIGLRNRLAVGFSWAWDYLTFGRRARLITESAIASPPRAQQ
jgi:NADH dehydrogenase